MAQKTRLIAAAENTIQVLLEAVPNARWSVTDTLSLVHAYAELAKAEAEEEKARALWAISSSLDKVAEEIRMRE